MTSSTAAELAAIRTAMQHIILQNPHQWVIFVDSKSALLALSSLRKQSPNIQLIRAILEIHQNALVKGHNIWVPGRCGITGNIRADNAAREAHKETATFLIPFSRTDSNNVTRTIGREITSSLWTDPHYYYKYLKHIDPKLEFCMPRGLSRAQETTLHRLRLNVAYTKKYLHLIGKEESPMCSSCSSPEDSDHQLCICKKYDSERKTLKIQLGLGPNEKLELHHLLGPWSKSGDAHKATKALIHFLSHTRLFKLL